MSKAKLILFFVVDGKNLEAQACFLAASIRKHMPADTTVLAYHRQDYTLSKFIVSYLESCNVTLIPLPGTGTNDPNPWSRPWPVGNKMLAKAQPRDCDISVYLDTDMVMLRPVDFEAELGDGEVLACVADFLTGDLDHPDKWQKIYNYFGLDVPEERLALLAGRKLKLPPFYNGGLCVFREGKIGKTREHFGEAWLKDCLAIDHAEGFDDERVGLDQTLYPVTIARTGVKFTRGPQALNYNVKPHSTAPGKDIAIAHYHRMPVILGLRPNVGYTAFKNIRDVLGLEMVRKVARKYAKEFFWTRSNLLVPEMIDRELQDGSLTNLSDLATAYGSDKGPKKNRYTELYQMLFSPFREKEINFLEMGLLIGGPEQGFDQDRSTLDCPSIRMWLEFFKNAKIHGLDVSDFSWFDHDRFSFFRCDMDKRENISSTTSEMPGMDIVLDDASHASHHQQYAFLEIFPKLKSGGLYVIEDLRWQPPHMERKGFTKTGELFYGFQTKKTFTHSNQNLANELNSLASDISGCFVFQENYDTKGRHQVAVIHKR